jgi:hypothetical protein
VGKGRENEPSRKPVLEEPEASGNPAGTWCLCGVFTTLRLLFFAGIIVVIILSYLAILDN